jgi:PAS domain S-box-containing protein
MSNLTFDKTAILDITSSILEALGKAFIALDEELVIVYASPSISAFIGQPANEVVGRTPADVFGEKLDDSPDSVVETLRREEIVDERPIELIVEGQPTPVTISAAPIGDVQNLPAHIRYVLLFAESRRAQEAQTAVQDVALSEANQIRLALQRAHWRREIAAKSLGMSRSTLWRKMRELHIE